MDDEIMETLRIINDNIARLVLVNGAIACELKRNRIEDERIYDPVDEVFEYYGIAGNQEPVFFS